MVGCVKRIVVAIDKGNRRGNFINGLWGLVVLKRVCERRMYDDAIDINLTWFTIFIKEAIKSWFVFSIRDSYQFLYP